MKNKIFVLIFIIALIFCGYYLLIFVSNYVGWYGYRKWEYRIHSNSISDSKKRKVFVEKLEYKIVDSSNLKNFYFQPYIEKGFRYGKKSKKETVIDDYTQYPYNLCYEYGMKDSVVIYIKEEYKYKLDSTDAVWGYLKNPYLQDTIYMEINSKNHKGIIKIW